MPHLHRFHIPSEPRPAGEVQLPPEEAHHALRVLRVREGEVAALFDGSGSEWTGRVARLTKRDVWVAVEGERTEEAPSPPLALAQAWLQREKAIEEIIRRGTALGVNRFRFFRAARSERAPKINPKWERLAIETCKQCGRLWLPKFDILPDLDAVLAETTGDTLMATASRDPIPLAEALTGGEVTVLVGPEGDFTDDEVARALTKGAQPISLGATTFRSEEAAMIAATLIRYELGGLGPPVANSATP